eukprot:8493940-Alexandrium_andersonii.AAC.1
MSVQLATASASTGPRCHRCQLEVPKPLRISGCKGVAYCSRQCRKDDWQARERSCKRTEPE